MGFFEQRLATLKSQVPAGEYKRLTTAVGTVEQLVEKAGYGLCDETFFTKMIRHLLSKVMPPITDIPDVAIELLAVEAGEINSINMDL